MKKSPIAAAVLAAAAAVLGAFFLMPDSEMTQPGSERAAVVDDLSGVVKATQNENELDAFKGLALVRENKLNTGLESWSRLELDEGHFAMVEENTNIQIAELADNLTDAKTTRVYMSSGKAWFDVSRELSEGEGFEIKTPSCALSVRGTIFSVAADESDTTLVVYRGEVALHAEGEDGAALFDSEGGEVDIVVSSGKASIFVENGTVSAVIQDTLTSEDLAIFTEDSQGPGGVYESLRTYIGSDDIMAAIASIQLTQFTRPRVQWSKNFDGSGADANFASAIQQTSDGGYIVAGTTQSNEAGHHGQLDAWILKLNSQGDIEWQKCLGGSGIDFADSIQETTDGGFIMAGLTLSSDGDVLGRSGGQASSRRADAWIVKLNGAGDILWQKCLGGSGHDIPHEIRQTIDGGYIAAGRTDSTGGGMQGNHGQTDAWVVKLNGEGDILWQKCLGGSGLDFANSIQETGDGGYIFAGGTSSDDGDVSGNHGYADAWVVKLNGVGDILWQKCLGGSGFDLASSILETSDGGYFAAGRTGSRDGDVSGSHGGLWDGWAVKLDSAGELLWQRCIGGFKNDFAASIGQASDGGFIIAGGSDSGGDGVFESQHKNAALFVKLSADGSVMWQDFFDNFDKDSKVGEISRSICQTVDGGYAAVVNGGADPESSYGSQYFCVIKFEPE